MIGSYNATIAEEKDKLDTKIEQIFNLQSNHLPELKARSVKERIARLKKLQKIILKRRKLIHKALWEDFHKPAAEVELTEIFPVISEIKFTIKNLKKWMIDRRVSNTSAMMGSKAYIRYEPKGKVLIISPWNYPVHLALKPLVSAIAAGNAAFLKPSEITPNASDILHDIVDEVFEDHEAVVFRGGKEVAEELLKMPFNHIFFTGSNTVGKIIMKKASEHLTSVTLQLGSKSPAIIDESANIKEAGKKIAWGKFMNCGQTCTAPDYIVAHESHRFELLYELKDYVEKSYSSNGFSVQESPDYARMVNRKQYERVKYLLEDALYDGATRVFGGEYNDDDLFIAPTVLEGVPMSSSVMKEEIFGPVLPVYFYKEPGQAIEIINKNPDPVVVYIFSTNTAHTEFFLTNTKAGGSAVNDIHTYNVHPNLPFGGINTSGHGNYNGHFGFKAFSNERAVLREPPRISKSEYIYPPYTNSMNRIIKFLVRYF
ncbi:MAG: aldehyde dehydrogenase family protein [Balneolales bacterium]